MLNRSVTYDVIDQINFVNNGARKADTFELIVALIHSIVPYQEVISIDFTPRTTEIFSDEYGNEYAKYILTNLAPHGKTGH